MDLDDIELNLSETEHSDEDVQLTPAEVIELMEEAWMNEKFAPEILPHKSELVDCLLGLEQHFEKVTDFYPGLPKEDWNNQLVVPNVHSFVFLKSKEEVEGIIIDDGNDEDGDLVDLNRGSQMIISYDSVSNLVKKGDVHLI
ncbi:hypothetical protein NQ318_008873 [Aromia moschata]|uniref:DNA replication complex GINS protein SLD5 C-terminal domain-containing protein n=1 Tax=Aromia moschata TaxID=1265417 RepID=A0AAV8ZDE7_9CUCU|nr:hypothetical protein NQ318_008873 [Aromia moschata]